VKKIIKNILKNFDYRLIKISKNNNSFDILLNLLIKKKIQFTFDIGANNGQFSKKLRDYGYLDKIVSFEPLSGEYEALKKNSLNDNKWEIYPRCALGNFDGNININVSTYSPSSSILNFSKIHQEAKPEAKMVKKETCPIYKLDTVINELKLQDANYCMKIDTQGYEKFIIEGAKEYLKNCKILYCEVSLKEVYNSAPLWFEIIDILKSQGFEIASIENGFTEKLNNNLLQADIIFVRND
jgi:FkbM family methyltransferase